jgi:hypothetical protein
LIQDIRSLPKKAIDAVQIAVISLGQPPEVHIY